MHRLIVTDVIEDIELSFRPKVRRIGNAGSLQERFSLLCNISRIASELLVGDDVLNVRQYRKRGDFIEWIQDGCIRIEPLHHVRLVY